ncbi:hypothetical protein SAMN06295974_3547 [Plantibacter flavus]|uniref:Uncharacterized protein n=1 Tax=Plantibacter flavus TaxID=150123 RepID=A0A3N2C6B3_9MICO|nr:hypothetical protein [Plantibacter flavus]ROR83049.1 hypothetical protein EDD42_3151 [Plantibacter flavus]SMG46723.1 hypothetical protein SAMN06295974_3547 [Plantibacter flavus]
MHGPQILANFLSTPGDPDMYGNRWQYNSRSDRHSKVGCWGVAFDLLNQSAVLRDHARRGLVVLGVNHTMRDFETHREKALDLVVARPSGPVSQKGPTFKGLASSYGIPLTSAEQGLLDKLPDIRVSSVGAVLIALEAKAAMTAHQKARPRLYDELNSSHLCVHGASNQALAIAYVQVNAAEVFMSSVSNPFSLNDMPARVTRHRQPKDVEGILSKVAELPRRSGTSGVGFDGIGVTVLSFENRGGPVDVVEAAPAPRPGDAFYYDGMIVRMAHEYDSRFHSL